MKAQLVGMRAVKFNNSQTGELVEYNELHLVYDRDGVSGSSVGIEKTKKSVAGLKLPCNVELMYDSIPGYNKAILKEIKVLGN